MVRIVQMRFFINHAFVHGCPFELTMEFMKLCIPPRALTLQIPPRYE